MSYVATHRKTGRAHRRSVRPNLAVLLLLAGSTLIAPLPVSPATLTTPAATDSVGGPLEIQAVELFDQAPGMQLEVSTSGELVWTSYRDADGNLIVELPNAMPTATIADVSLTRGLVESAHLQVRDETDGPLTRLVVQTNTDAEHYVAAEGDRLIVDLTPVLPQVEPAEIPSAVEEGERILAHSQLDVAPAATPVAAWNAPDPTFDPAPALAVGTVDEPYYGTPPAGEEAGHMYGVDVSSKGAETVVHVVGDGQFQYSSFALRNPDRFVLDLTGVTNNASVTHVPVDDTRVERVRLAQFKQLPDLVARVVIDLAQPIAPRIETSDEGLSLTFGSGTLAEPAVEDYAADVAAAEESYVAEVLEATRLVDGEMDTPSEPERIVAEEPEPEMAREEPVAEASWDESSAEVVPAAMTPEVVTPVAPAVAEAVAWEEAEETTWDDPEPVEQIAAATPEPWPAAQDTAPAAAPVAVRMEDHESAGVGVSGNGSKVSGVQAFQARSVNNPEPDYRGEPITMSLKDSDIKDVLRSFAQLSGLNIVVQPGVAGSVTVELTEVPWDQALEQILKINGLDYELEGNIMRIAPISQLRAEAQEQQKLRAAQALSIPLRTIVRRVSYAEAREIATVLGGGGSASIMSQRGSVVVDNRTNTLIIKELPDFIDSVIAIIEQLDIPEPQVMIESRIIETTKRFSRTLGIDWSLNGTSSAATGNTTGLVFPNNGAVDGGVQLLTGARNGFLDVSLGNVLNTFSLDAVLQAAETEGLINILSAPKITTLNNERASIQSGLQIPIQTVANNTVSVQFVNATLRLDVTPHVTAEGTVLMDISIQKREPQLAFAVAGANNAPISTKDAKTRVIVRDGGTTVIGGIYQVSSDHGEDRVPGLSNIPILGHLFKNKRRDDENEELLIFITPRVVKL